MGSMCVCGREEEEEGDGRVLYLGEVNVPQVERRSSETGEPFWFRELSPTLKGGAWIGDRCA
jgi:hypothetical protein